jgi:hypothetical protein
MVRGAESLGSTPHPGLLPAGEGGGHGLHLAAGEHARGTLTPARCLRLSPLRSGSQREREKESREAIRRPAGAGPAISCHTPNPVRSRSRGTAEAAERGVVRGGSENQSLKKPNPLISFL